MQRAANHFKQGTRLPSVSLPATDRSDVDLATVPGRSLVIVYPWTGRPGQPNPPGWDDIQGAHGSTPELEGFRDHHPAFERRGISLFGLSRQATDYQQELVARLALPFPILSDEAGRFAAALGLPGFTIGDAIYLTRLTFIVSSGRIERVFYPVPDPAGHAAAVLLALGR
ncbi:MAG TPA: peroxiredoxin [Methyloceanibacter sp.]|nr:peroxiredoxin [Methyloceanibacter sp.]